jgi:heterodisulfide reductase subunit A
MDRLWNRLERLGIRPERLQLEWMSAAEGQRFAQVMAGIEEMRAKVSRQEIKNTKEVLGKRESKKKRSPQS